MLKVIELFAGIGSQSQALKNLNIDHTTKISEIDKFAIKSYNAIHGETENLGDISKIKSLPYADLVTYSFPCQDLSISGKQKGIKEGTRSGLLLEVERLLENMEKKPKFLLLENVKNLIGKRFKVDFDKWLEKLEKLGYKNYWRILNAKDYGIPQNRERVFVLSIRGDINKGYKFEESFELKTKLKDVLEESVDEKYYIPEEKCKHLLEKLIEKEISKTVRVGGRGSLTHKHEWDLVAVPKIKQIGLLDIKENEQIRRVYDSDGISPTLNTMQDGNRQPKIVAQRGRYDENGKIKQRLEARKDGVANTLTTVQKDNYLLKNGGIRKLTPNECWKLMGFRDDQFKLAESVCSNSQLYKQAGNSIVVNVLESIFRQMIKYGYIDNIERE